MNRMFSLLLGACLLAPLPSLADDLTSYQGNGTQPNIYISNNRYLIHISQDGSDITGSVWENDAWSTAETIFTDSTGDFELDDGRGVYELQNDTLVMSNSGHLISYSDSNGFQYFANPVTVRDTVINDDHITFVSCNFDEADSASATMWDEDYGFSETVSLTGSLCADDLSYMTGQKNALIDYYTGNVYDVRDNYALIASNDLTDLDYIDASDDYDSQGNNPQVMMKKNGDVVFAFEDHLYGYAYHNQTWNETVTLDAGYSLAGVMYGGEYEYPLFKTENNEQIFAFATNADQTEYQVYRWTSANGWQMEKNYSFDSNTELITVNIDKSKGTFNWAFWENDPDKLKIYEWSESDGYEKLTTRNLNCNAQCSFTLDVSKKGKLFFVWENSSELYAGAWKPGTDSWENITLSETTEANPKRTHVTADGRWIVEFYMDDAISAIRWTPDNGWGEVQELAADATFYNEDLFYYVALNSHELMLNRLKWKTGSIVEVTSLSEISNFEADVSFIFNDTIFLYYVNQDNEHVLDDVAL